MTYLDAHEPDMIRNGGGVIVYTAFEVFKGTRLDQYS